MDLEEYRVAESLTYEDLAARLGLSHRVVAREYALGKRWPNAVRLQGLLDATASTVTVEAMHRRRLAFLDSQIVRKMPTKSVRFKKLKTHPPSQSQLFAAE
jgi:transcriptional regulator with XRE-family HTH domain